MVDSNLQSHEVVGETWQLIGPAYRPIWGAYAQALKENATDRFFQEYGVSSAERTEVEVAIGLGFEQRLRRYQPVCLALWRRAHPDRPGDDFHREWDLHSRTRETATAWLAWDNLQAQIELASRADEPEGTLMLFKALDLSVQSWQRARGELGDARLRFTVSERTYISARGAFAAHVMAWFAYLVVPRASGASGPTVSAELADAAGVWVEQIRGLIVPSEVAEENLSSSAIIVHAAQDALRLMEALPRLQGVTVLLEPLGSLVKSAPSEVSSIKLKDEPDKAALTYERDEPAARAQQAAVAVDAVVKVASAIAAQLRELERLHHDALTGKGGIAVQQQW